MSEAWRDLEAFRDHLLVIEGKAPATADNQARAVRWLIRHGLDPEAFTDQDAARQASVPVLAQVRRRGPASTFNNYAKALNALARFHGLEPIAKLRRERPPQIRAFTDAELARILAYRFPQDSFVEKRRRAVIWLALHTGMRRSELARMEVQDLMPERASFRVKSPAKNGPVRIMPVEPELFSAKRPLAAWLAIRPQDSPALFQQIQWGKPEPMTPGGLSREAARISQGLGIRFNFTRTRHTRATRLLRAGMSIRYIQVYLGHARLETTARYAEVDPSDIQAALQRATMSSLTKVGQPHPKRGRPGNTDPR